MIRTGEQYRESIRDGREVFINGERVADVTTHPMFKPLVDIRARFYDMQHDPATAGIMTYAEDGEVNAIGNKLPLSQEDWPVADLRVDWHDDPVGALAALWALYRPQLEDYVRRALDPDDAPGFGVPGEE
jgi:4-hydroxyphenylacetate 3-monooxygenase